ncbi:MAG TPA: membrane protein insertase YidC [Woeseiaceae bacterium]|nr:membrane protein insertase YidC [Woeseiaceae bacterium]
MDNQRLITWGLFGLLVYFTWQTWMQDYAPSAPSEPANQSTAQGALESKDRNNVADQADQLADLAIDDQSLPQIGAPATSSEPAAATPLVDADAAIITVRTDVLELKINTRGGTIQYASTLKYPVHKDLPDKKIVLLDTGAEDLGLIRSWLRNSTNPAAAPDANAVYTAASSNYALGDKDELVVPLTWENADGTSVEKRFTLKRGSYVIDLQQILHNGSDAEWRGDQVTQLLRRSYEHERSMFDVDSYSYTGGVVYNGEKAEKLKRDDLLEDGPASFTAENGWYASIEHHFLSAIIPAADTTNIYQVRVDDHVSTASVISAPETVAPGASTVFDRTLFIGPKLQEQLKEVHPKLTLSVDYGWLTILSHPLFLLLSWIHSFIGNWGVAIILVTALIKLAFYKLTEASGRSMAKMRELQPRMKALQDRYKDDRQALSQAMMDLYKREKVNPAAGCLPILIQMPFFLSFYWVLVESVEMRQAPFALWITDLSSRDPYFILPLIMGAAMLVQQRLNPAPADPMQARIMQIMPVMFTGFFAFFPSGLVLYWVTNTLLSIAQQWKINKVVHAEALARKAGKPKKPKKNKAGDDSDETLE